VCLVLCYQLVGQLVLRGRAGVREFGAGRAVWSLFGYFTLYCQWL
jgi:hypothetical protein